MALDLKIVGGTVHDGEGGAPRRADIGVRDGVIVEIGEATGPADRIIDAEGAIVTPGFLDVHSHYDGQASWDPELRPSVDHGVTTAVMGSCGVGFAPVRPGDQQRLIELMEGVEDIPGVALAEGMNWDWESFPQYMDALGRQPRTINIAAQVTHDPLRVYVMGDRAVASEPATEDDIAAMRALAREAMQAGAVGLTTGRTDVHRTARGDWTPSSEATAAELTGIASALDGLDHGVLQAVSDFDLERGADRFDAEFDIIEAYARASGGKPFSLSLMQRDFAPDQWKRIIARSERLKADGIDARFQVAPRAIGVFLGLQCTFHPLMAHPSYRGIADRPLGDRIRILRDPDFRARLLAETPIRLAGPDSSVPPLADMLIEHIELVAEKLFRLGEEPDYEQPAEASLAAEARANGKTVWETLYDVLLEDDGRALIYLPIYNYTELSYDNVLAMMRHPQAIMGLGDGGAHVGTICDASFPTYLMSYWTRDRDRGDRIPLERAVRMLTADLADYLGMTDRGRLKPGLRADINVIDPDALGLKPPRMVQDLPAGGRRLLQDAVGYRATLVAGEPVALDGALTRALPGRLARIGGAA